MPENNCYPAASAEAFESLLLDVYIEEWRMFLFIIFDITLLLWKGIIIWFRMHRQ